MDPVGISQPIIPQAAALHAPSVPAVPVQVQNPPASNPSASGSSQQAGFDVQAAEQKRYEAVQKMSQDIANVYVVSDKRFTIFKDASGQYITRFTSLRDGKVTYIPEPELFKIGGGSDIAPVLKIQA